MNEVLKIILETKEVYSSKSESVPLQYNIPIQAGEFLQEIIGTTRPQISLEIGLAYGISSLFICEAMSQLPQPSYIAIDPWQSEHFHNIGIENLKRAGYLDFVDFYEDYSYLILPELVRRKMKIDFAFVDGNHLFDYTLVDFFYIDKLLNIGGIIVFDDTNSPSVEKVCRFLVTNHAYQVFKCMTIDREFSSSLAKVVQLGLKIGKVPSLRCIAFQKISEDLRYQTASGDFYYQDF